MKIGYRIKNLRIENKLTQQQLADMLSISQQAYSKYENNKVLLPIKILCKLADIYNISTDYILDRKTLK